MTKPQECVINYPYDKSFCLKFPASVPFGELVSGALFLPVQQFHLLLRILIIGRLPGDFRPQSPRSRALQNAGLFRTKDLLS